MEIGHVAVNILFGKLKARHGSPTGETTDLNPVRYGFESHPCHSPKEVAVIDYTDNWYENKAFLSIIEFFVILVIGCLIIALI